MRGETELLGDENVEVALLVGVGVGVGIGVGVRVRVGFGVRVGVRFGVRVGVGVGLRVRGLEVEAALEHLQRHAVDGGHVVQAEHALCWHVAEETDLLPRGQRHLV